MIVNNLHPVWTIFPPREANAPLLVYADALLPGSVSPQRFEVITGKIYQIFNANSTVEYLQLPLSLPSNGLKTGDPFAMVEIFSVLAGK